jgi:hypothetical protein
MHVIYEGVKFMNYTGKNVTIGGIAFPIDGYARMQYEGCRPLARTSDGVQLVTGDFSVADLPDQRNGVRIIVDREIAVALASVRTDLVAQVTDSYLGKVRIVRD